MGGHDYTDNLKGVHDSVTSMSAKIESLLQKITDDLAAKETAREEKKLARQEETDALTKSLTEEFLPKQNTEGEGSGAPSKAPHVRTGLLDTPRPPPVQLKFPVFDGDDPDGWIFQEDQYFLWHSIANNLKVNLAAAHLKGEANDWFRWKRTQQQILTWVTFCTLLRERFQKTFVDPKIAICTIKQKGSVKDFLPEFEHLLNFVDFEERHLINLFILALKPEVGNMVKLFEPTTLSSAFKKALNQDEVLLSTRHAWRSRQHTVSTPPQFRKPSPPMGNKLLTVEEQRERQAKGLCFNCDEQYTRGHVCVQPRLLVLEVDSSGVDDREVLSTEDNTEDDFTTADTSQDQVQPTISLHSLLGSSFPKTMRLDGYTKSQPLRVLIDSGSTHNFLLPRWAKHCGYSIHSDVTALQVTVGNGTQIPTKGCCLNVPITLQNHSFTTDFHILDIGGYDVVLGVQWLRTLGPIMWDFSNLTMQFTVKNTSVYLQGSNCSSFMLMDSVPMQKLLCREIYAVLFQLTAVNASINDSGSTTSTNSPALQEILSQYADIFATPTTLPPE
ncbi:uncharacterized protein LOC113295489 [Papaver somniferum]|uniref:uncharacterized protein LOC113295489 n=1 Tax=Papaver somniferum TaxID=3469 RepID=UPI000E6F62F4|nr:uncharacterized protein LOC113295489 [Papaver somniferum]